MPQVTRVVVDLGPGLTYQHFKKPELGFSQRGKQNEKDEVQACVCFLFVGGSLLLPFDAPSTAFGAGWELCFVQSGGSGSCC